MVHLVRCLTSYSLTIAAVSLAGGGLREAEYFRTNCANGSFWGRYVPGRRSSEMNCTLRQSGHEVVTPNWLQIWRRTTPTAFCTEERTKERKKIFPEVHDFSFRCYHHLGLELGRDRQENRCVGVIRAANKFAGFAKERHWTLDTEIDKTGTVLIRLLSNLESIAGRIQRNIFCGWTAEFRHSLGLAYRLLLPARRAC